ncbi:MAG TPA: HAMP domain-containing sensor histidine kinase [Longimicrobium sp.]|nr:HAMP domain-containing sensor histidine kinase [Longimicrobium sp.]
MKSAAHPDPEPMPHASTAPTAAHASPRDAGVDRRARELEALRAMAVAALDTVDPEEIFRIVCAWLPELLGADFAALAVPLMDEVRDWCAESAPPHETRAKLLELLERGRRTGEMLAAGPVEPGVIPEERAAPAPFGSASALVVPLASGGPWGALLVGWHRRAPLSAAEVALAEEVAAQAAAAFRNAARYDALRQAAVRRERFFSAMSHDLRTPLTAILGYSELLQDGIMGDLDARQQEMVERICQVSSHLAQLVNDVLDLAKLDAGRMEFHREPVALGDLVDEAILAVEPQARGKGLELRMEIDPLRDAVLDVDPPRVRQVLVNLLANAVKFTDHGAVSLSAGAEDGRSWISVADTGPGIPAGSEEAVFEEFLQIAAGNKAKREPGSGLGLAISRRMARAMGGDLTARNGDSGGAVFTLYLPLEPSAPASSPS